MFSKCFNCSFNVRQTEKFCFNCGLEHKNQESVEEYFYKTAVLSIILAFIPTITVLLFRNPADFVIITFVVSCLISFVILAVIKESLNPPQTPDFQSLRSKEKVINRRFSELVKRGEEISLVISQIEANPTARLQAVKSKLLSAQEVVSNQAIRYELQTKWIDLVRLQNRISPILEGWQDFNSRQIENALTEIETSIRQTENAKNEILNGANKRLAETDFFEKTVFFEQLNETKNGCEQLRETLLTEKAFRALRGLQTSENGGGKNTLDQSLTHQIETFNIQTTLTDFSEAFDKLETEYQSLKAENEISQNLLNYEN